jgi:hypothetical protein
MSEPEDPPAAPVADGDDEDTASHEWLAKMVSERVNAAGSTVYNRVSRHVMPGTISFATIADLHKLALGTGKPPSAKDYLATEGKELVYTFNLNARVFAPTTNGDSGPLPKRAKKRRRDDREDQTERVAQTRDRLARATPSLPQDELNTARDVLTNLVNELRGPSNEVVVQSFAILARKLSPSDTAPRVVISLRLNAGVAVSVALLKRCLGPCWTDGAITIESSVSSVSDADMPLSVEAEASRAFGNSPLLLVTSVPRK